MKQAKSLCHQHIAYVQGQPYKDPRQEQHMPKNIEVVYKRVKHLEVVK